jgi:hypothetical protein
MAAGAINRAAGSDATGHSGGTGSPRHAGEPQGDLELPAGGAADVQKSLHAAEQDRPDVARRRTQWKKYQGRIDPRRLVFIDETWAKTNMTRLHGRCRCGDRLVAKVPHGRWRTLTFLAALCWDRIEAPS